MLEFLFGIFFGVWMGQQLPMPNVHRWVITRFSPPQVEDKPPSDDQDVDEEETVPLFTGDMPAPAV